MNTKVDTSVNPEELLTALYAMFHLFAPPYLHTFIDVQIRGQIIRSLRIVDWHGDYESAVDEECESPDGFLALGNAQVDLGIYDWCGPRSEYIEPTAIVASFNYDDPQLLWKICDTLPKVGGQTVSDAWMGLTELLQFGLTKSAEIRASRQRK